MELDLTEPRSREEIREDIDHVLSDFPHVRLQWSSMTPDEFLASAADLPCSVYFHLAALASELQKIRRQES